jgi:hypothetical protein
LSQDRASSYRLLTLLTALLLVGTLFDQWQYAIHSPTIDFFTAWSVPHYLSGNPVANIYSSDIQADMGSVLSKEASRPDTPENQKVATEVTSRLYDNRVDATGSPLLYTAIGLLSTGHYETDHENFILLSMLCSTSAIVLLCRLLRFSALAVLLLPSVLWGVYAALISDVRVGNTNQIQLLAISLFVFLAARSKRVLAGLVLALAIMLKPNLILIAALLFLMIVVDRSYRRHWPTALGVLAGLIVSLLISISYFGTPTIWVDFAKSLPQTLGLSYPLADGNFGLAALIFDLTRTHTSMLILSISIAIFAVVLWQTREVRSESSVTLGFGEKPSEERCLHEAFDAAGIGCALMLLSSGLVWLHYYLLLIPLWLYVARPRAEDDPSASGQMMIGTVAVLVLLMLSELSEFLTRNTPAIESLILNAAAGLLVALALRDMWFQRKMWAARNRSQPPRSRRPSRMRPA